MNAVTELASAGQRDFKESVATVRGLAAGSVVGQVPALAVFDLQMAAPSR
jgi:hypothetical protein